MDRNKKQKPSTYVMLQSLDREVQKNKTSKNDNDYDSRSSSGTRKRRSASPKGFDSFKKTSRSSSSYRNHGNFKRSSRNEEIIEEEIDYDIPDRSHGDLYCKACDSHMNSEQMWEAHIQGKRHQKHVKKGDTDLKYETKSDDPLLLPEIKKSKEAIVGLQHCCEIQRLEGRPIYQCFLCSANVPNGQSLLEHVITVKHRMAYLKEHDPVKHELISKTDLKKGMIEPVVEECIRLHQNKYGHGRMQVRLEKKRPVSPYRTYKKPFKDEHDSKRKVDERKISYSDNRIDPRYEDTEWRRVSEKERDYYKAHVSSNTYEDRYPRSSETGFERTSWYPEHDAYDRDELSSAQRRPLSPITAPQQSYDQNLADVKSHPTHKPSSSYTQVQPPKVEDLRVVLEQRRMQEMKRTQTEPKNNNTTMFESLVSIVETLPTMLFLELVLHKVEKMNPSDTELSMLQKIGNHMISIVMDHKLKKLSPDLLSKYQQSVDATVTVQEEPPVKTQVTEKNDKSSNLHNLMDLISHFQTTQSSTGNSSVLSQQHSQLQMDANKSDQPAFMTQSPGSFYSMWGASSATSSLTYEATGIPGLTLSGANETPSVIQSSFTQYPQDPIGTKPSASSWPSTDDSFKDYYTQYR